MSQRPRRRRRSVEDEEGRNLAPLVGAALLLAAVAVFVVQNSQSADIEFLFVSSELPLGIALLLAAAAGGAITALLGFVRRTRRR